jgi:hypothetical protein
MTDYNVTRDIAGKINDRFSTMLKNLKDDFEDDIVVVSLMESYEMVDEDEDEDLSWAIEKVLAFYMTSSEYNLWLNGRNK